MDRTPLPRRTPRRLQGRLEEAEALTRARELPGWRWTESDERLLPEYQRGRAPG